MYRGCCTATCRALLVGAGLQMLEDFKALRPLLCGSRLAKDKGSWRDNIQQILEHTQRHAGI